MAYLVIALGVLMTAAGGYLLNYGYSVVQVERGWSSVIAGSVILTGGLVVICIGLVLRALGRLRSFATPVVAEALAEPAVPPAHIPPVPIIAAAAVAGVAPMAMERHLHDADPVQPEEEPVSPPEPVEAHHLVEEPAEPIIDEPEPLPELEPVAHVEPVAHIEPEPHPAPEPPAPEPEEPTHAPPMDDWLDRAFSDLDKDPPHADTVPQTLEPERVPEPAHAEAVAEHHAPEPEPAPPAPEPQPESPQSQVIGRYESDGTSYVMYADGSIEAQSAAGVYRFASMAELKAFIEG